MSIFDIFFFTKHHFQNMLSRSLVTQLWNNYSRKIVNSFWKAYCGIFFSIIVLHIECRCYLNPTLTKLCIECRCSKTTNVCEI